VSRRIHIVPNGSGWAVKREGTPRPLSNHRTQENAQDAGRPVARRDGTELVIHRPNGTIRDSNSYGNDPCPPRDKN